MRDRPRILDRRCYKSGALPGEVLGLVFAGYMLLASQSPYPIIVYSLAGYRPHRSHYWEICNIRDPSLVTFYLSMYLILNEEHFTFYLQYKNSGTFANRKCEELSYPISHL